MFTSFFLRTVYNWFTHFTHQFTFRRTCCWSELFSNLSRRRTFFFVCLSSNSRHTMQQDEHWPEQISEDQVGSPAFRAISPVKLMIKEEHYEEEEDENEEKMQKRSEIRKERPLKRKRTITISDKVNILYKLDEGVSTSEIARKYGITASTISKIKKRRVDYLSKASNEISLQQKNLRGTQNPVLEDTTYAWLCQQICLGEPINGPILCEKALVLNEKMNGPSTFKASNGWLHRFKIRHGIRQLVSQNEKMSTDTIPTEPFVNDFKKFVDFNGYETANIYNADETGLNWKSLPTNTILSSTETTTHKEKKDRVTALLCANATGTHKIPALIIGKQEKIKCFGNVACLPVIYKSQANSLMDRQLFIDWYTNHFIPAVRQEQEKTGNKGKVLLLLDSAPCHSSAPILNSIDENFSVTFLSPNVTTVLQPMNQGIIEATKRHYRKTLTIRLLLSHDIRIDEFLNNLTIKDCCEIIASSWQSVTSSLLVKTWQTILPERLIIYNEGEFVQSGKVNIGELVSTLKQIENFNVTESDVVAWLNEDNNDHGWAPLTDDELIAEAIGNETFNVNMGFKCEPDCEVIEENEHYNAEDALGAINMVYKWYEKQQECILDDLMILNKIRNTAMEKVIQEK